MPPNGRCESVGGLRAVCEETCALTGESGAGEETKGSSSTALLRFRGLGLGGREVPLTNEPGIGAGRVGEGSLSKEG